jgi:NAD(P)-dependent dehydrogenase (short-subunit alcohol dehydrogenase family)
MNIIIIGGSRGIGKEIAGIMSQDSSKKIIVTGRNESSLKNIVKSSVHRNIYSIKSDLSKFDEQAESFREQVYLIFNRLDILINNAGALILKDFMSFSNREAREMMETNFFGPASVIRVLSPLMTKGSHIVNISSMGGFQGSSKYRGLTYYSASKAALGCLTECLATEFNESGISVNCLALGSVQTEMMELAFPGYKAPVTASEMARFVADFAVTGNKFFNGKIIPVAVNNP